MILLAFRHGLRAAEVCDLRWEQVDFKAATLHVRRTKNGTPATHPLTGRELRALRRHQREAPAGAFVFVSERGAPPSAPGFSRMVERAGRERSSGSRSMPTCCAMPWVRAGECGHDTRACRPTSGTGTSKTQRGTRPWPRGGSRGFGGTKAAGTESEPKG